MAAHAAVGIDDDLAAGEARISHGPAHHEAARGVDVDVGVTPGDALAVQHGRDHMLEQVGLDDAHILDGVVVLSGDHDGRDLDGPIVLIADRHLGLAVGAQIREGAILAHGGQALGQALGEVDGHGHEDGGLVARIAEHHALVARADARGLVLAGARERTVDALGDIGALLVDHVDDAAGLAVEAVFGAVVADAADHIAGDLLHIHVGLGADLARDEYRAGGREGLAGAAHVVHARGPARGRAVALCLESGLLGQYRVENRIRDLVADLVRVPLGDGFRGEEVIPARRLRHARLPSIHGAPEKEKPLAHEGTSRAQRMFPVFQEGTAPPCRELAPFPGLGGCRGVIGLGPSTLCAYPRLLTR